MPHQEHYVGGIRVPSVTEVLAIEPMPWLAKWRENVGDAEADRIMQEASKFGSAVHAGIEFLLERGAPLSLTPHQLKLSYLAASWALANFDEIEVETSMESKAFLYGGTADFIGIKNETVVLVDWKTSKRMSSEYVLQLAAYAKMWEEINKIPVHFGAIVRLEKDRAKSPFMEVAIFDEKQLSFAFKKFRKLLKKYWESRGESH